MKNQMDRKTENEIETGGIQGIIGMGGFPKLGLPFPSPPSTSENTSKFAHEPKLSAAHSVSSGQGILTSSIAETKKKTLLGKGWRVWKVTTSISS